MKILVVDDSFERLTAFGEALSEHEVSLTETADAAIEMLSNEKIQVLYLDHDLGDDGGSGQEVADFLFENRENFIGDDGIRVLIHSWNPIGVDRMYSTLKNARIPVERARFDPDNIFVPL